MGGIRGCVFDSTLSLGLGSHVDCLLISRTMRCFSIIKKPEFVGAKFKLSSCGDTTAMSFAGLTWKNVVHRDSKASLCLPLN